MSQQNKPPSNNNHNQAKPGPKPKPKSKPGSGAGSAFANQGRSSSNKSASKRYRSGRRPAASSSAESQSSSSSSWLNRLLGGVFSKSDNESNAGANAKHGAKRKPKARGLFAKFKTKSNTHNPSKKSDRRQQPRGQRHDNLAELCTTAIGMDIVLSANTSQESPLVIARAQHQFSRRYVSSAAIKVLKKLHSAGFAGYLVGGGVRDVLLGMAPKDFDIATDAHPEQIKKLFERCRIIGRRFRLVHVYFRGEIVEVSTFRAGVSSEDNATGSDVSMLAHDNVYGTVEEDAWRRDFTINALYYNIADFSLVDYTAGLADLQQRKLRVIGDPEQRFHEDPVRMLRAIRMAAKLDFVLEEKAEQSLIKMANLLEHVPTARLFDEIIKLLFHGHAQASYKLLDKWGYLKILFPNATAVSAQLNDPRIMNLIKQAVVATDKRFAAKQSLNPGFLLSVLFWPILMQQLNQQVELQNKNKNHNHNQDDLEKNNEGTFLLQVTEHVWKDLVYNTISQKVGLKVPRRLQDMVRAIWDLQWLLEKRKSTQVRYVLQARYFRAAVDFLALRAECGFDVTEQNDWWWQLRNSSPKQQQQQLDALPIPKKKQHYRRRNKKNNSTK